jgi:hypothetical protein
VFGHYFTGDHMITLFLFFSLSILSVVFALETWRSHTSTWRSHHYTMIIRPEQQSKSSTHTQLTHGKGNSKLVTTGRGKPIILYFNISSIQHFIHYVPLYIYVLSCNTPVWSVGLANNSDDNFTVAFRPNWSMQNL